ncbi:GNAT family N-acetyltransferase [Clostridium perfringens]|nr:GNAT family N-acetyltransferase [Clostridium perfringens]
MNIVRFKLWDYFKYAKLLNLSFKRLCNNYFVKVTYKNDVLMLWEIDYAVNLNAYIKKITKVNYNRYVPEKGNVFSEFKINKYIYETMDDEGIDLNMYGFVKRASNIILKLNLTNFNKKNTDDFNFRPFIKGKDESLRCNLQNEIFYEENRIPLKTKDIVYECSRKAFLADLAFFELRDNNTIGYGQILLIKGKYTVANFGIVKEFRGKGYGEALLVHILNQAKLKGLNEVYIKVKSDNTSAVNLYKKMGFKESSEINIYELLS